MAGLVLLFFTANGIRITFTSGLVLLATKGLHSKMTRSVIRALVLFFDTSPVGRVVSRFAKDLAVGDSVIPLIINWFVQTALKIAGVCILVCVAIPWMVGPVLLIAFLMIFAR